MNHIIGAKPPALPARVQMLTVDADAQGQRLDNFLVRTLKGVPKTHVYRIIRSGEVRVNKARAQADTRLACGDVLRLPPVRVSERAADKALSMAQARMLPSAVALPILYEDDSLLALDKPAGLAVHGGSGVSFGVIEQLRIARPQARFLELVHRLDRETSGILLVAKKRSALLALQDQFRARETGKTYLALVQGDWPRALKVLDRPLHKYLLAPPSAALAGERRVRVVGRDDPEGMAALTLVKVRASGLAEALAGPGGTPQPLSLLEVTIKTGRTHQIRVHLASEGMPILGDDKYGDFSTNKRLARAEQVVPLKRLFLHAWRLQCTHPVTGVRLHLQAPLHQDLSRFLHAALPAAALG